eukprot:jgi/Chrzof1/5758/Cz16g14220.t1
MSTCHAATLSRKTGRAFAAHRCCKQTSIRTNAVLKRQPTVTARHQHASRGLPQEGASRSPLATTQTLKAQLLHVVTRLNTSSDANDIALTRALLELVNQLAKVNPTPRPAESSLINGRWVLLYTLPDTAKDDVQRPFMQATMAALYEFFYKYVPIIAGSAVGPKPSMQGVIPRGNFQTFDTFHGVVNNQAKFEAFKTPGEINVDGSAQIASSSKGDRLVATFTSANLTWGNNVRLSFPINIFSPTGYIDTLYLDEDIRISKGDKGSMFVARRALQQ